MNKLIKFIIFEFLYNGHLQALGSVSIVYLSTYYLLGRIPSIAFLIIIYLTFQPVFLHDRYKDLKKDKKTNSVRTKHLQSYAHLVPIILFSMFASLVLLLLIFANIWSILLVIFILIMGLLYPIYFKGLTKQIYFFKNFYVAGVYGLLVFVPFVYYGVGFDLTKAVIFLLMVFFEAFLGQMILDTKDTASDSEAGLKTFAATFGNKTTFMTVVVFSIVYFIVFYLSGNPLLAAITLLLNAAMVGSVYLGNKIGYFLAAGQFLVWLCVVLTINII